MQSLARPRGGAGRRRLLERSLGGTARGLGAPRVHGFIGGLVRLGGPATAAAAAAAARRVCAGVRACRGPWAPRGAKDGYASSLYIPKKHAQVRLSWLAALFLPFPLFLSLPISEKNAWLYERVVHIIIFARACVGGAPVNKQQVGDALEAYATALVGVLAAAQAATAEGSAGLSTIVAQEAEEAAGLERLLGDFGADDGGLLAEEDDDEPRIEEVGRG